MEYGMKKEEFIKKIKILDDRLIEVYKIIT